MIPAPVTSWTLTDHVCAECLGRVLRSLDGERTRCSNCGAESTDRYESLCCCGIRLKNGRDAGIRCMPNPQQTPELPCEIVATEVG